MGELFKREGFVRKSSRDGGCPKEALRSDGVR